MEITTYFHPVENIEVKYVDFVGGGEEKNLKNALQFRISKNLTFYSPPRTRKYQKH